MSCLRHSRFPTRYSLLAAGYSLFVAINPLAPLVPLLRLDRQGGDGRGRGPLERDRLAGLLAIAVGSVIEPGERGVDLGDQLALAVTCPELDRTVGLGGGAVGEIGVILVLGLEVSQRLLGLFENLLLPREQFLAEILPLALAHEGLFVGRSVDLALVQYRDAILMRRHCNPVRKLREPPCSRGELISARALADNIGIVAHSCFGAMRRNGAEGIRPPPAPRPGEPCFTVLSR